MRLWPDVGRDVFGWGRTATYNRAVDGTLPVLKLGGRYEVPTAALRRMLGLDPVPPAAAPEPAGVQ